MASNELRLFVSSTFRDLMPEREQLVKKIFPRIRKECRERGVEFTEIDLRWGITEEESRTGRTVRICLEEIDRPAVFHRHHRFTVWMGSRHYRNRERPGNAERISLAARLCRNRKEHYRDGIRAWGDLAEK